MVWTCEKERSGVCRGRTLEMEVLGRRKRGRLRKRWLDVVQEDMESVSVVEEDVVNRGVWRKKICCGNPK